METQYEFWRTKISNAKTKENFVVLLLWAKHRYSLIGRDVFPNRSDIEQFGLAFYELDYCPQRAHRSTCLVAVAQQKRSARRQGLDTG